MFEGMTKSEWRTDVRACSFVFRQSTVQELCGLVETRLQRAWMARAVAPRPSTVMFQSHQIAHPFEQFCRLAQTGTEW
jgi:hypothetical protein